VNPNAQPSQAFALQYSFFLAFRTSRLDTCLRRAAVRSADDLLVTAYVRAAVYLRWPSATRCKGAAKSIRFPARHAQAFDDYHLSLPRVELDKLNQPDVRRLKPARLPCRHRLVGIETVPISPMLHQLRARVEKRRRSVAHVEFRSRGGSRDKSDLLWVGTHGATILAGHLLDSVVRNSEIRRGAFGLAIPAKIPAKWTAAVWAYAWIFNPSRQFSGEIRNRTSALCLCYCYSFFRGAPGRQSPNTITN
jgi:hypothetical protein